MEGRDHERLVLMDEAEVRDEPGVEDLVDRGAVVHSALRQPPDARPGRRRRVSALRGHARKRTEGADVPGPVRQARSTPWTQA